MVANTRSRSALSAPTASRLPECASERIGASELLSSCAMTRMTFFHTMHFLGGELARQLLEEQQLVRLAVEDEAAPGEVVDLGLAADLHGEQCVAVALERLAQRGGGFLEQRLEREPLELAAAAQELARGDVAVDDPAGGVGQRERERRRLQHRIEKELALVDVEPLAAQQVAEGVVGSDQLDELAAAARRDADAEITIAQPADATADGFEHARPRPRDAHRQPDDPRRGEQQAEQESQRNGCAANASRAPRERRQRRPRARWSRRSSSGEMPGAFSPA